MNPVEQFQADRVEQIAALGKDDSLAVLSRDWIEGTMAARYVYNFDWLGRPIIQYPQDMVAMQELIWKVKPDLIIETGIAHGGSLILSASILALLDMAEAIETGASIDPAKSKRHVLGVDIDIRAHNKDAITSHPMASRISMIEGSSVEPSVIEQVESVASQYEAVLVCLDSMHTHQHVLAELNAYAGLVTPGSYCVVFDTFVEDMPPGFFKERPWDVENNPKTAVLEFLSLHSEFEADLQIDNKLLVTAAPHGYLRKKRVP